VWDTGQTPNWLLGSSLQTFYTGDTAVFDDTGYNTPPVSISGAVYPAATIVSASQNYTFTGGTIGSGTLTKNGSGTLTLENDNLFSGVLVNAGTLQVGSGGYSGTIAGGPITNNATLVFNRADALAITNEITGSGVVKQVGSGQTVLTGSNSFTGLTLVEAGTLSPRNSFALGATNGATVVTNAGLLYLDANVNFPAEPLVLQGAALRKGGAGTTVFAGPVTLVGDTTLQVDGNATLVLSNAAGVNGAAVNANLTLTGDSGSLGVIAGPLALGAGSITKDGVGAWKLAGPGAFGGFTAINNGELIIGHPQALGSVTNLPVNTQAGGPGITGTRITVADGTAVSNVWVGLPSDASYRSALFSRGTGGVTNIWAGPIAFTGYEGTINFGTEPGAVFIIAGPVTNVDYTGSLILRGTGGGGTTGTGCTGIISAPIKLNPDWARVQIDDGATWIIAASGHSFVTNNITSGTLRLGTHNALPTSCNLTFGLGGVAAMTFDLAGYNQQLGSIATLATTARVIGNSSTTSDSLLTLAGPNVSMFGGTIVDSLGGGTRKVALALTGGATLTLTNVNTYSGDTTIGSGCTLILAGDGSIANSANIILHAGATIDVTGRTNGTLTISPVQVLKGNGTFSVYGNVVNQGTIEMKVNKAGGTLTSDRLQVSGSISYGGTLSVVRSGDPLAIGDSFTLFSATSASGNFGSIAGSPGPGLAWSFNPANGVLSVMAGVPSTPTNISWSVSGGNITISWPASHTGWILQVQTNALTKGISTNWVDVPGSASTNVAIFPIVQTNGTVFFRLRYP
ncbi:MAG: autotransporter-associated beta strand repeat-containing protein, partial [Verrucomicrobiae bacterium]|nr:autotransporter-associated beta strand repeat-containing protein [Verrucomicrobiae bacterium]